MGRFVFEMKFACMRTSADNCICWKITNQMKRAFSQFVVSCIFGICGLVWTPAVSAENVPLKVYEDAEGWLEYTFQKPAQPGPQTLVWRTLSGVTETVFEKPTGLMGAEKPEQVFRKGNKFAMITGSSLGTLEYHLFQRAAGEWKLLSFSPLGGPPPDSAGGKLTSLTDFQITRSNHSPLNLKVTDLPLLPDSIDQAFYRLVTSDIRPYHPQGIIIHGATWDQSLEKTLKDCEARKRGKASESPKQPEHKSLPLAR